MLYLCGEKLIRSLYSKGEEASRHGLGEPTNHLADVLGTFPDDVKEKLKKEILYLTLYDWRRDWRYYVCVYECVLGDDLFSAGISGGGTCLK